MLGAIMRQSLLFFFNRMNLNAEILWICAVHDI